MAAFFSVCGVTGNKVTVLTGAVTGDVDEYM